MKMRKKRHIKRLTSKDQTDWYNIFFKSLADPEFQVQLQLIVDNWTRSLEHYNEKWSPHAS